jgi:hypothetical protein
MHPLGTYMAARGATCSSNEFVDPALTLGEDHFENIRTLIASARKQGHDGIDIRLTPESLSAIQSRVMELAVLEEAEVDARFYGEHRGCEVVIVTFPNEKHNWLFDIAKRELQSDEYAELRQLVSSREMRTEREISLTEKALSSSSKSESHSQRSRLVSSEYDFNEFCQRMFGKDPNQITSAASAEITYAQQNERKRTGGRSFRVGSRGRVYCDDLQDLIRAIMGTVPDKTSPIFQTAVRPLAHHLLQKWGIVGLRDWLAKNGEEFETPRL